MTDTLPKNLQAVITATTQFTAPDEVKDNLMAVWQHAEYLRGDASVAVGESDERESLIVFGGFLLYIITTTLGEDKHAATKAVQRSADQYMGKFSYYSPEQANLYLSSIFAAASTSLSMALLVDVDPTEYFKFFKEYLLRATGAIVARLNTMEVAND